jgi:peptide-methionine (S)-S-oxide reductase
MIKKAGFGGGCHWCTEAVFSSLKGVLRVDQGWIASAGENSALSEGVVVEYDDEKINLQILIQIHIYTHSATSVHSLRSRYRSAIYYFDDEDRAVAIAALHELQTDFKEPIITKILPFNDFKVNIAEQLNYYFTNPERPFCETYINPKLRLILSKFDYVADDTKLDHLL